MLHQNFGTELRRGFTARGKELTLSVLGPAGSEAEGQRRLEEVATARLQKPLSAFSELLADPKP